MTLVTHCELQARIATPLSDLDAQQFDRLVDADHPYLKHSFLSALERSGCVCESTGWKPMHFSLHTPEGVLLAFAPLYLKYHSYGEYVFDWAWADAYQRHRLSYYPKMTCSIPFTPSVSPRLLVDSTVVSFAKASEIFRRTVEQYCAEHDLSSAHVLFPKVINEDRQDYADWLRREGVQYHWFNRGYPNFDAFLAQLNSSKRKNIRKERNRLIEQGIRYRWRSGSELSEDELRFFIRCYTATYNVRGQMPYLNEGFFETLFRELGASCSLLFALDETGAPIASALFLEGDKTLYGRYWGAVRDVPCLHFELCYYAGIERCIERGLERFDAGAQGEHKLMRGFEPIKTRSYHYVRHPEFRHAIDRFLVEEREHVEQYRDDAKSWLPYKQT